MRGGTLQALSNLLPSTRSRAQGPNDGSEDLFLHHTGLAGSGFESLEEGASVSYEVAQGRKGMQAVNVSSECSADRSVSKDLENFLPVPLEVEGAARILVEHFDPDDRY